MLVVNNIFRPFWNESCSDINSQLLSHIEIDCADLDSTYLNLLSKKMVGNSWFSTNLRAVQNKNSLQTYYQSYISSLAECMDLGDIQNKSRMIRIYPTNEQKKIFLGWLGVSRLVYNKTIEYKQNNPQDRTHWMQLAKIIFAELPDFCNDVPYQIKKIAVSDACDSIIRNCKKVKNQGGRFKLKFKSRKNPKQSCYIPKSAIKEKGIYYQKSGIGLTYTEPLPEIVLDSRLIFHNDRWFIAIPTKIKRTNIFENQEKIVAIDPGIRTFTSFFSENTFGQIGMHDIGRIQRLCSHLDDLQSKISQNNNKKRKRAYKIAANRMRWKIKNLVDELHHKVALFYVSNFDIIFFPTFQTSQMIIKRKRKLKSKSVRQMLTFRFHDFAKHLECKCLEFGKICIRVDESFTSQTNSFTGNLMKIGSKEHFVFDNCRINRDINGARNILIRALVDQPIVNPFD
jgi:putative transposase